MHTPTKQLFVFVVHRHNDEKLRAAWRVVVDLSEREPRVFKVVGVAGGCGVPHVGELAFIAHCAHVEKLLRDFVIEDEVTVEEPSMEVR
jgi:hypothetical protein